MILFQFGGSAAETDTDAEAAKAVEDLIAALPGTDALALTDEASITAARAAYNALTETQKALVTNEATLKAAEDKLAELKAAAEKEAQDKAAAAAVDQLIDKIGDVTLESETAITAARTAYDALDETQQGYVTKFDTLTAAETQLQNLKDAEAAKAVKDQIAALPAADALALTDEASITAARAAYNALTDTQKGLVPNEETLKAAEAKLAELKAQAEKEAQDKAAAEGAEKKINELPDQLTLEDKTAVDAAQAAYDALTPEQQAYVSEAAKQKLESAQKEIARLEEEKKNKDAAAVVEKLIDAIGEVTVNSKPTIDTARDAYNQLTEGQKNYVSNYDKLEAAEAKYPQVIDQAAADRVSEQIEKLGEVTLESQKDIQAARDAYNALTDSQKKLVSEDTYKKLTDAEAQYKKLTDAEAEKAKQKDEAAAAEVSKKIESIGSVTKDSKEKIQTARSAYDQLTDSQKKLVSADTYKKLTDAEAAYAKLTAESGKDKTDKSDSKDSSSSNKTSSSSSKKTNTSSSGKANSSATTTTSPATGDTGAAAWLMAFGASAICAAAVAISLKKRRA